MRQHPPQPSPTDLGGRRKRRGWQWNETLAFEEYGNQMLLSWPLSQEEQEEFCLLPPLL